MHQPTCPVEVGGASDADLLLAKLHIEQHGLVRLGPREVEARLQALSHGDPILEGALIEAVAGELRQGRMHAVLHLQIEKSNVFGKPQEGA